MIELYNTLTRKKQQFEPSKNNTVRMYSCGPTVYSYAHIGNFRAYVFMDTLRRVLKFNGFKLDGVMNITDVGHLTSDADEGEDKMEKASRKENKTPYEIAEYYTKWFMLDAEKLNIEIPEHVVKATDCIEDIINFVQGIIDNGFGYVVNGNVYFDVTKLQSYGQLSGIKLEDLKAGARIAVNDEKHSPYDFALWIKAPENHIMKWNSPWSVGYPGWHIECSTIGKKYLGETFDIHTGGVDHIPVHHENELAQTAGYNGTLQARFWMHVEFLQVDGGKMSKSLGNCYRIEELEEKGYDALDYRYFCLNAHYRKKLNFTFEVLDASKTARNRLNIALKQHKNGTNIIPAEKLEEYRNQFISAINDDLNIPLALGVLWTMVKAFEPSKQVYDLALEMDKIFGLSLENCDKIAENKPEIPQEIVELAEQRFSAKKDKNYALADELRAKIEQMGYAVADSKDGYTISKR